MSPLKLPVTQRIKPPQYGLVFKAPIVWLSFCWATTPNQKLYGTLTPSAFLTPGISTSPQDLPSPGWSAQASERVQCLCQPLWGLFWLERDSENGFSKDTSVCHLPQGETQDRECADSPCRLWLGRAGHLLRVAGGRASHASFSPAVPQFPEASTETPLLTSGQWMVPRRGVQDFRARSTVCSFGK